MIEIMEPTDFVVRLEFERGGYLLPEESRFMGRGIDFALDMIEFKQLPTELVRELYFCEPVLVCRESNYEEFVLIGIKQTSCFSVNKLKITGSYTRKSDNFHVGIISAGNGIIKAGTVSVPVKKGDRFLIPYTTKEVTYTTSTGLEIILTSREV